MLATEHTLLRMFLNIWRQISLPGDLHDAALYNFCMVHSLSSGKVEMFLCAACHAFTAHVNAWER